MLEQKLQSLGLWLIDATSQELPGAKSKSSRHGSWFMWGHSKRRDLIDFCTLMNFQSKVGIPLIQALEVAAQECESENFKEVIQGLKKHLEAGLLFYEALERFPHVFSTQFVSVVKAGETSSKLPETFEDLKGYLEWLDQIIADIRQASIYPLIVSLVVGAFVLILFSMVIPKFATLLEATGVPLPLLTQIVFSLGTFAKTTWWLWTGILLFFSVGIFAGRRLSRGFARFVDQVKLKLPVFGELNLMLCMSRFSHNLAILYRSGIPIIKSLEICQDLVGNIVAEDAVADVKTHVASGQVISESMKRHAVFPTMLIRMVIMGEKTGNLDYALTTVSEYYNVIIPRRIKKIFAILEPALILFLIVIVGFVAVAIFLPILSLMDQLK